MKRVAPGGSEFQQSCVFASENHCAAGSLKKIAKRSCGVFMDRYLTATFFVKYAAAKRLRDHR